VGLDRYVDRPESIARDQGAEVSTILCPKKCWQNPEWTHDLTKLYEITYVSKAQENVILYINQVRVAIFVVFDKFIRYDLFMTPREVERMIKSTIAANRGGLTRRHIDAKSAQRSKVLFLEGVGHDHHIHRGDRERAKRPQHLGEKTETGGIEMKGDRA
jgi:hypothetical protein